MKWLRSVGIVLAVGMMVIVVSGCPLRRRPEPEVIEEEVRVVEEEVRVVEEEVRVVEEIIIPRVFVRYTVRRGDSLWSIANSFYGEPLRWEEIWRVNRDQLPTPDALKVGMVLIIPKD